MTDIGVVGVKISNLPTAPQALDGSEWVPIDQNGATVKTTSASLAKLSVVSEVLTIVTDGVIPDLAFEPDGGLLMLVWNKQTFLAVGSPPDFSVVRRTLTWLNSLYVLTSGSVVTAIYTHF